MSKILKITRKTFISFLHFFYCDSEKWKRKIFLFSWLFAFSSSQTSLMATKSTFNVSSVASAPTAFTSTLRSQTTRYELTTFAKFLIQKSGWKFTKLLKENYYDFMQCLRAVFPYVFLFAAPLLSIWGIWQQPWLV